jgi:NTP pyrophosphatase (non-canonical NTP hydrolase)
MKIIGHRIIDDLTKERIRQNKKWGEQNHSPEKWLAILAEEVGEAAKAICERMYAVGSNSQYREELIHVAAVAIAAIESYDRNEGRDE